MRQPSAGSPGLCQPWDSPEFWGSSRKDQVPFSEIRSLQSGVTDGAAGLLGVAKVLAMGAMTPSLRSFRRVGIWSSFVPFSGYLCTLTELSDDHNLDAPVNMDSW